MMMINDDDDDDDDDESIRGKEEPGLFEHKISKELKILHAEHSYKLAEYHTSIVIRLFSRSGVVF